jgi:hypothetical protein
VAADAVSAVLVSAVVPAVVAFSSVVTSGNFAGSVLEALAAYTMHTTGLNVCEWNQNGSCEPHRQHSIYTMRWRSMNLSRSLFVAAVIP